jgi:hypothetical protein
MPLEKSDYKSYMQSAAWLRKSRAVRELVGACENCGSPKWLCCHHFNYLNLGEETFDDLICLCNDCHNAYHRVVRPSQLPKETMPRAEKVALIRKTIAESPKKKKRKKRSKPQVALSVKPSKFELSGEMVTLTIPMLLAGRHPKTDWFTKRHVNELRLDGVKPTPAWMSKVAGMQVHKEHYEAFLAYAAPKTPVHPASLKRERKDKRAARREKIAAAQERRRWIKQRQARERRDRRPEA